MEQRPGQEESRRLDRTSAIMAACTVVLIVLTAGLLFTILRMRREQKNAYAPVLEAAGIIEEKYYFLDDDAVSISQNAIRGMLAGLGDPYAAYYTEDEYEKMLEEDAGDYRGIGVSVMTPNETGSCISVVYEDSPMAEAGALAGDIIINVNGTVVAGLSMNDFMALFSDEDEGTDTLVLRRNGVDFTVTVTRRAVHATRVYSELLDDGAGYIRIEQFTGTVVDEFREAASSLIDRGAHGLVVDLRDNPGGGLTEVLGLADYLLPKDSVICTIKSREGEQKVYRAEDGERMEPIPMAVLVNGGSASASELLSGALQDHGAAKIVGTQTFGKGIVQSYYRLRNGAGWVKLTTDAYYTPNDVCIQKTGITPDIVVEQKEEQAGKAASLIPHSEDAQLLAALDVLEIGMQAAA